MVSDPHILIVVDDYPIAIDLEDAINTALLCQITVTNSVDAEEVILSQNADLVLIDCSLNIGMVTGLLDKLITLNIPLICLLSSTEQLPQAYKEYVEKTFIKPFDYQELIREIRAHTNPAEIQDRNNNHLRQIIF